MSLDSSLTIREALLEEKIGEDALDNEMILEKAQMLLERIAELGSAATIKEMSIRYVALGRETDMTYYNYGSKD